MELAHLRTRRGRWLMHAAGVEVSEGELAHIGACGEVLSQQPVVFSFDPRCQSLLSHLAVGEPGPGWLKDGAGVFQRPKRFLWFRSGGGPSGCCHEVADHGEASMSVTSRPRRTPGRRRYRSAVLQPAPVTTANQTEESTDPCEGAEVTRSNRPSMLI